jgi:hypothetical protein
MSSVLMWSSLLEAIAVDCGCDPYTVSYLLKRFRNEGVRFMTVTLPKLGKSVLRSIELGMFDRPTDFAWKGRSLRHFRSLLNGIFSQKTGKVLDAVDEISFYYIRQLSEYCYKLGLSFAEEQLEEAKGKYRSTQKEVGRFVFCADWVNTLRRNAENYYNDLANTTIDDMFRKARPRTGSGSFVGSEDIYTKYGIHWSVYKNTPDDVTGTCNSTQMPFSGFFKPYTRKPKTKPSKERIFYAHTNCQMEIGYAFTGPFRESDVRTRINTVHESTVCRVLFVPKDSRGPRVISKEAFHRLRGQLAFFDWLSAGLTRCSGGTINFGDQSVNRRLAQIGSLDRSISTLDLKDASDRVSYKLVKEVFKNFPAIRYMLTKQRATHYELDGITERLNSVGGMGSGLTFPILAFIIQLSVCSAIVKRTGFSYEYVRSKVYVYGDDLIVPTGWYHYATSGLEHSNLLLNKDKSYVRSLFRESCGGDYYNGNECAPIRLKLQFCELPKASDCRDGLHLRRSDAGLVVGLVKHAHLLRKSGLNRTAAYVERTLSGVIPMPYVGEGSPVLGRYTWDSSLVWRQGALADKRSPDGYLINVATVVPVNADSSSRCPYKYMAAKVAVRSHTNIQHLSGDRCSGSYEVSPLPRQLRLKFGTKPVISATKVVDPTSSY